jgi:hypothetical protein
MSKSEVLARSESAILYLTVKICYSTRWTMRHSIVVAMLLLLICGYATTAGAADSGTSQPCEWWYLGVLRYIMPLAIALDAFGREECRWQYDGNASLAKALDLTPHKP